MARRQPRRGRSLAALGLPSEDTPCRRARRGNGGAARPATARDTACGVHGVGFNPRPTPCEPGWAGSRTPRGPDGAGTRQGRGRAAALSSASDFRAPRVSTGPASAAQKGRGSAPGTRRAPALRCARRTWLSAAVSTRFSLKTAFCLVSECFSSTRLITAAFETALPSAGKAQLGFSPFSKNRCFLIGVYGAFSALSHADPSSM